MYLLYVKSSCLIEGRISLDECKSIFSQRLSDIEQLLFASLQNYYCSLDSAHYNYYIKFHNKLDRI